MSVTGKRVSDYVSYRISRMASVPDSAAKASLARLRRGVGTMPGELPELWGDFLADMPENMFSGHPSGSPSYAEWAVYTALTLYALHQQGRDVRTESVHQEGKTIGTAAADLVEGEEDRERIWRRFYKAASADDMVELAYYLRGMVQLFKANGISLDYARLAGDLYDFQFAERTDSVRLRWGEDFYRTRKTEGETDDESKSIS